MNFVKFDNPAQAIVVSLFSLGLVYLFSDAISFLIHENPTAMAGGIRVQYFVLLIFVIAFIFLVGLAIRLGHFIDFLLAPESALRGLYAEAYFAEPAPRISIFSVTYSVSTRRFAISGIAFQGKMQGGSVRFLPHSVWNSSGVSLRYVDGKVSGIFYSYKGQRLGVQEDPSQPGYTWVAISEATESTGYFSDIVGTTHKRTPFRVYQLRDAKSKSRFRRWFFNPDAKQLARFTKDEHAGADLLTRICAAARSNRDAPSIASQENHGSHGFEVENFWLPTALVQWLRDLPTAEVRSNNQSASDLLKEIFNLSRNGYVKYSDFPVVSCVVSSTKQRYFGVNYENASYPEGMCAEAVAIGAMVTAGERSIDEIYLQAARNDDVVPCGGCLQKICEFASPNIMIHTVRADGTLNSRPLSKLLPDAFRF